MATTVTSTIKSSGGDYSSLSAWEAAKQADIVAADQIQEAECYDFAVTDTCTIAGWTVDATRYIRIFTPSDERHDGTTASGFRMTANTTSDILRLAENFIRIEGLALIQPNANVTAVGNVGMDAAAGDIRVSHCVVSSTVSPVSDQAGWALYFPSIDASVVLRIWNNIIYDWGNGAGSNGYGINLLTTTGAVAYVYNNTIYNCRAGIVTDSTNHLLKNNICDTNSAADYSGTVSASCLTNLSSDTSSPNAALRSLDPTYTNEAGRDLHLASGDGEDDGTDLSADGNIAFSDDIDGDTRTGSWDVGADEIVAIAANTRRYALTTLGVG